MTTPIYSRWSADAAYCFKSGADCSRCPVSRHYGMNKVNGKCKMPDAVAQLQRRGVKFEKTWKG